MGKDFKQRTAYKYLHGDLDKAPPNLIKHWNRINFREIGESRSKRKEVREKDIDKVIGVEIFDYIHI